MSKGGDHTWDLYVHYHRCPQCGYIIENRKRGEQVGHDVVIQLTCPRCNHAFTEKVASKASTLSFLGEAEPKEMDWS